MASWIALVVNAEDLFVCFFVQLANKYIYGVVQFP